MDVATSKTERERQRLKQARTRAAERDLTIPPVADRRRRRRTAGDVYKFLSTYFGHIIWQDWTTDRREMVEALRRSILSGGDQAIAAPRGEGKTTLAMLVSLYFLMTGQVGFTLIVHKNQRDANRALSNLKGELEHNDLLRADWPAVCVPIAALRGWASNARMQTVKGEPTRMEWGADHLILPTVNGSQASGRMIAAVGIDGAIRGLNFRNVRPDLVIIDDVDDRESAKSETQTADRASIIDSDIAGLAGPGKTVARVMLCTIINRTCIAATYTDPKIKPSWQGKRFKAMPSLPANIELWDEYIRLRQEGQRAGDDPYGRRAEAFYLSNRMKMEAGAEVSNQQNFDQAVMLDGRPKEVSSLQHCYNVIASIGWENFATECQNEPPEEKTPEEEGITAALVQSRINGLLRGIVPARTDLLTAGIDVGKFACHYAVTGWLPSIAGIIPWYGVQEVWNADQVGSEKAVLQALRSWRDEFMREPVRDEEDEPKRFDRVAVDAGYCDQAVHQFVEESGLPFIAVHGEGSRTGRQGPYRMPAKRSRGRKFGEHWYATRSGRHWLYMLDADYWKGWVHERLQTATTDDAGTLRPGSLSLFGDDTRTHISFSKHITAEYFVEEFKPGKGLKRYWKKVNRNNHWLDATCMACAAAAIAGMRLMGPREPEQVAIPSGGWFARQRRR